MERFSLHFICRNFKEIPKKKTQKKQGTNKQSNKMNKRNQEIFDPPPHSKDSHQRRLRMAITHNIFNKIK